MCILLVLADFSSSLFFSYYNVYREDKTLFRFRDTSVCCTIMNPARYVIYECTPIIPMHVTYPPTATVYGNILVRTSGLVLFSYLLALYPRAARPLSSYFTYSWAAVHMNTHLVLNDMRVHACTFCGQRYLIGYSTAMAAMCRTIACIVLDSQAYIL